MSLSFFLPLSLTLKSMRRPAALISSLSISLPALFHFGTTLAQKKDWESIFRTADLMVFSSASYF
jgi:hypothetical protein